MALWLFLSMLRLSEYGREKFSYIIRSRTGCFQGEYRVEDIVLELLQSLSYTEISQSCLLLAMLGEEESRCLCTGQSGT